MAVLPYVASKMPVQVDMRHTRAIHLNIVDEKQYQELVEVAAEPHDNPDGFSVQLLATAQSDQATNQQAASESPAAQAEGQRGERPVTPTVPAAPPGDYLRPASEWWDSAGVRRQRISDTAPAGDERDRWQRTDSGTWTPPCRKDDG